MSNLPNPYVGPRAYEEHEKLYGRDREIRQLVALLVAERIVLLHSPSGAGKTSLLQAGLIPRMDGEDFHVLPVVRVNLEMPARLASTASNRYLLSTLLSLEEDVPETHRLNLADLSGLSLDAYLARRYRPPDASPSELMVFDQFEEVLTVLPSDRDGKLAFFDQLGMALRNRNRWAVFAMREDYVAALSPYLRPIPNRLSAVFRLDLLGREAARQAIQRPAQEAGVDFTTPAAEKLVDDLSQVQEQAPDGSISFHTGLYVEPVQLQVVCYRLWDTQVTDDRVITVSDLGQVGSVDDSLADYYAQSVLRVTAATGVEERTIREWFGSQLITPEDVRSQVLQHAGSSAGLDNRAIFQLVDAHILRAEKRAGSTWFELAHDRMISPVRKSNTEWFAANLHLFQVQATLWEKRRRAEGMLLRGNSLKDAEQEAKTIRLTPVEQEFLEACTKARAQEALETRNKRTRSWLLFIVLVAVLGIAFMSVMLYGMNSSQNQALQAKSTAEAASTKSSENEKNAVAARSTAEAERARANQYADLLNRDSISRRLILKSQALPEFLGDQYALKGLLAVQAARLNPDLDSNQTLTSFLDIPGGRIIRMSRDTQILSLAFSPGGQYLVSGDSAGFIFVWDTATGERKVRMEHNNAVNSVDFSPDGLWIVSGSEDTTARVWEAATGRLIATMQHDDRVSFADISKDGNLVVTNSGYPTGSSTVRVWKAATGELVSTMPHNSEVASVAFSPDGRRIATGSKDCKVEVWDVASQNIAMTASLSNKWDSPCAVNSVAFSSDGLMVVSGSADGTVRLWDPNTGDQLQKLQHDGAVNSVAFSPDGMRVVSGSDDGTARVWLPDLARNEGVMRHNDGVLSVAFSPDGNWLVTSSRDNTVRVWKMGTGDQVAQFMHLNMVTSVAFSPDSRWVASGSLDTTVQLWEAVTDRVLLWNEHDYAMSMAFSPGGDRIVTGSGNGSLQVWETATGRVLWREWPGGEINTVAFSPDGRWIVTGNWGGDNTVRVWEAETGTPVATMQHGDVISIVAFSPDSLWVISGSYDKTARVWEAKSGREVASISYGDAVRTAALSPDGSQVVTGSEDGEVRVWETKSGKRVASMQTGSPVASVAFSPDGRRVVSGSWGMIAQVWEVQSGNEVARMEHYGVVFSVAFSGDGARVVSGSHDGTVKVWDANTGNLISEMQHKDYVNSVAFSPDGQWVLSSSKDGTARVWRSDSGQEVAKIQHDKPVISAKFSPDGAQVASVAEDRTVKLSLFHLEDLILAACSRLSRNLARTEWQQYIGPSLLYEKTCPDLPEGGE